MGDTNSFRSFHIGGRYPSGKQERKQYLDAIVNAIGSSSQFMRNIRGMVKNRRAKKVEDVIARGNHNSMLLQ